MRFINRKEELEKLERLMNDPQGGFVVVYGRRRVGKTRLLIEWTNKNNGIYWVADESPSAMQRQYFAEAIATKIEGFADVAYPTWNTLFQRLTKESRIKDWRGPLVIDELPYLVSSAPEIPSLLQRWIDHEAKENNMVVAISGSSQRMMQGIVLDENAPLYGRASVIINLQPIAIKYIKDAFKLDNYQECIKVYTFFGGIPRYWELASQESWHLMDSLDSLVLDPMGVLHQEPYRLLMEEQPSASGLRPILDAIGYGAHRLTEIAGRLQIPATSLSKQLTKLQELGLIQREIPFGDSEKNNKKSLYKIADPFLRLWFTIVAPRKSIFANSTREQRLSLARKFVPQLQSVMWEELCRKSVHLINENFTCAQRYWNSNDAEFDVLSADDENKRLLIGECKWVHQPVMEDEIDGLIQGLIRKGIPNISKIKNYQPIYALFIPEITIELRLPENIFVLDAKNIVEGKFR